MESRERNSLASSGLDSTEPMEVLPDEEVMLRLRAGEETAFEVLLSRYRRPVVHFIHRMVRDPGRAEELAQDVFIRLYKARKRYQPRAKFTTWLFRIATNVGLNALRDDRHRREKESSSDIEGVGLRAARVAGPGPTPESKVLDDERNRQIRTAVERLPDKQRVAVLLHKYQGLEYAEISGILGCSQSALKSLLFRAYETLRVTLRPMMEGETPKGAKS